MDEKVKDYLKKQRVSALAVLLPNCTPHVTTLHYSHVEELLTFYFSVDKTSKKCQTLMDGKESKAALVVGFDETNWLTFQAEGTVRLLVDQIEIQTAKKTHYPKHPNSKKFENDPNTVFLLFKPVWWRYTDLNVFPPLIIEAK